MPIVVDIDERCARISEVASSIIARAGLQGLTIRAIAQEVGYSTSFVTDFFADKRSIMLRILSDSAGRATKRILAALRQNPVDLLGCAEAYLPLDESRRRDWKIYVSFWELASHDPEIGQRQLEWQNLARDSFSTILGRLRGWSCEPAEDHDANKLLALIMGVSTLAVFDEQSWTPDRMRAFLRKEVEAIIAGFRDRAA